MTPGLIYEEMQIRTMVWSVASDLGLDIVRIELSDGCLEVSIRGQSEQLGDAIARHLRPDDPRFAAIAPTGRCPVQ